MTLQLNDNKNMLEMFGKKYWGPIIECVCAMLISLEFIL